jgi:hypothetical protein
LCGEGASGAEHFGAVLFGGFLADVGHDGREVDGGIDSLAPALRIGNAEELALLPLVRLDLDEGGEAVFREAFQRRGGIIGRLCVGADPHVRHQGWADEAVIDANVEIVHLHFDKEADIAGVPRAADGLVGEHDENEAQGISHGGCYGLPRRRHKRRQVRGGEKTETDCQSAGQGRPEQRQPRPLQLLFRRHANILVDFPGRQASADGGLACGGSRCGLLAVAGFVTLKLCSLVSHASSGNLNLSYRSRGNRRRWFEVRRRASARIESENV